MVAFMWPFLQTIEGCLFLSSSCDGIDVGHHGSIARRGRLNGKSGKVGSPPEKSNRVAEKKEARRGPLDSFLSNVEEPEIPYGFRSYCFETCISALLLELSDGPSIMF